MSKVNQEIDQQTPILGVPKEILEFLGFTSAHKAGLTGSGQVGAVSDTKVQIHHPAFAGKVQKGTYDSEIDSRILPNVVSRYHGDLDIGEIAAQPSYNQDAYGAAYDATILSYDHGHLDYNFSDKTTVLQQHIEQLRGYISNNAKVINMSYTPTMLLELAKDLEGKELLTKLLIEQDALFVIAAGNDRHFHGVNKSDQQISKDIFVNANTITTDEALEIFKDHIVYVGALCRDTDEGMAEANENYSKLVKKTYFKNIMSFNGDILELLCLITRDTGKSISEFAVAVKNITSGQKDSEFLSFDDYCVKNSLYSKFQPSDVAEINEMIFSSNTEIFDHNSPLEEKIKILEEAMEQDPETKEYYISQLEDRTLARKKSAQESYQKYLGVERDLAAKELLKSFCVSSNNSSICGNIENYYQKLIEQKNLATTLQYGLEKGICWDMPQLQLSNGLQISSYSCKAGLNEKHFIFTLGGEEVLTNKLGGTSHAAPLVTAAILLGMQKYPDMKSVDLVRKLFGTADKFPGLEYWYGQGVMNLTKFLELSDDLSTSAENFELNIAGDSVEGVSL